MGCRLFKHAGSGPFIEAGVMNVQTWGGECGREIRHSIGGVIKWWGKCEKPRVIPNRDLFCF